MRFNEFKPIKYITPGDLVDKGASALKSLAKGTAGALGTIGAGAAKGVIKTAGAVLPDFDPLATTLTKGSRDKDKNNKPNDAAFNDERKIFKAALDKKLNNEPLSDQEIKNLQIGINKPWLEEMDNLEFKTALTKLIRKQTLSGAELVLIKQIQSKLS
jgi:hypothetical protein